MKFVTFQIDTPIGAVERVGVQESTQGADRIVDLQAACCLKLEHDGVYAASEMASALIPPDMTAFLERWPASLDAARAALAFVRANPSKEQTGNGARIAFASGEYRLRSPLRPRRIRDYFTYEEHKKRSVARRGREMPKLWYELPSYTNRNHTSLAHPEEDIIWPSYTEKFDFEFEMAVVIGKAGRDIKAADAAQYIAGYTIYNDLSARDMQAKEVQVGGGPGKSKDFAGGNILGPCLATPDELDADDLDMTLRVNGEVWSTCSTKAMAFSWAQIIENASWQEWLLPGDVIASGTMNQGCCVDIEKWIAPGNVIEMEAKGIGTLRNRIVRK